MTWLLFIGGLLLGIILGPVLLFIWISKAVRANHVQIKTIAQLQEELGFFLERAPDRHTGHLFHPQKGPHLRLIKYARKTKPDALVVEVRRSQNEVIYQRLCEDLAQQGVAFEEYFTKQRRNPKLIRIKIEKSQESVVQQAGALVETIFEAVHGHSDVSMTFDKVESSSW